MQGLWQLFLIVKPLCLCLIFELIISINNSLMIYIIHWLLLIVSGIDFFKSSEIYLPLHSAQ